jgi:superfamily II DNA or RNA helicase
LVAIKCLDEGVDIPPAKFAIMLSNSGNPREYIQRRGRILRKYPNKKYAIINDIIVKPSFKTIKDSYLADIERKIFKKEIQRFKEFANLSRNSVDCMKKLAEYEEEFLL